MTLTKPSDIFEPNKFYWKMHGIWPGRKPKKYYNFFTAIYLVTTLLIFNILLTLNLIYCPQTVELLITEVMFYFNEIVVTCKVIMVIIMKQKMLEAFDLLDSETFGEKENTQIIPRLQSTYKKCWTSYFCVSHVSYAAKTFIPYFGYLIFGTSITLPICKYYFLSDYNREKYFFWLYIYQCFIYSHMVYNISIDMFFVGLIVMGVGQFRILNHLISCIKYAPKTKPNEYSEAEEKTTMKDLVDCLKRYDLLLRYCELIQEIMSVTMFVQYLIATATICVIMSALLLVSPWSTPVYVFMVTYLVLMVNQIFMPGYLGSLLTAESEMTIIAAYQCDWIDRPEPFKRNLKLLIQRANTPVVLTALKMFPLSLGTFISIMKSAYSFFTLIRNVQQTSL